METNLILNKERSATTVQNAGLKGLLESINVKKRFEDILGANAPAFMSSILSLVNANEKLKACEPNTVLAAAAIAASLNLPVNQNLGYSYIVPYRNNKTGKDEAQFQIGSKGFVQLAQRTGQYLRINNCVVYEGQLKKRNYLTGEFEFDFDNKLSDKPIGYASYFKLINGFESTFFMTLEEVTVHAKKYSKSYQYDLKMKYTMSPWSTNFDSQALKTVNKLNLSRWGVLSAEMQKAIEFDQAVVRNNSINEIADYVDSGNDFIEAETSDIDDLMPKAKTPIPNDVQTEIIQETKVPVQDKIIPESLICSKCNSAAITPKIREISIANYGQVLCVNCQKISPKKENKFAKKMEAAAEELKKEALNDITV